MRVPKYCKNGDGRAFVAHPSIPTKSHRLYLGTWGTRESRERYEAWVTQFLAGEDQPEDRDPKATVAMLALQYLDFARGYYVSEGVPTKEYAAMKAAVWHLLDLYAETPAAELGPRHLRELQRNLVGKKYRRGVVNLRVNRVKRFIKWCCARELIPTSVYHGLSVVDGLRKGRSQALESRKVKPVPREDVEALLPFMPPTIGAMVQVQLLAGMRPGEVCIMRGCDLDMSGPVWLYRPASHKTQHSGRSLVKAITQEAQRLLLPFLSVEPGAYIFSPASTKEWRYSQRTFSVSGPRKTPVYPSELKARERRKAERAAARGTRKWGTHYTTDSYRRAIWYAHSLAEKNGVKVQRWHPHQLRHTIATEISHSLGEQAAQVWLGHASLNTTAIYTERNVAELLTVAHQLSKLPATPQSPEQSAAGRRSGSAGRASPGKHPQPPH